VLAVVAGCTESTSAPTEEPAAAAAAASAAAVGDRYIIVLREDNARLRAASVGASLARMGGRIERDHAPIGVLSVRGLTAAAAAQVARQADVEAVVKDRAVQWVEPGRRERHSSSGLGSQSNQRGAAFFDQFQWNIKRIRAQQAWNVSTQGEGVTVCVLDTGVDPRHIDLEGKLDLDLSASFVGSERADRDFFSHGTDMASIISSNGIGMASVAPDSRLCSVKVLDRTGSGSFSDILAGIMYVGTAGVEVANMSFGALLPADDPDVRTLRRALQRAVNFSTNRGVLFVASAGNDAADLNDPSIVVLPAQLDNVISVGATGPINQRQFDRVASYSNFGRNGVDVFAPGGEFQFPENVDEDLIIAACSASFRPGGGVQPCATEDQYFIEAGTSPSAAHVSGQAAVIEAQLAGDQTPARLTSCILQTADELARPAITANGRINVLESLGC